MDIEVFTAMRETKNCWKFFQCSDESCPAFGKDDPFCWLMAGVRPRRDIHGKYLEPMEACLECEIFEANAGKARLQETFQVIKKQFKSYRKKVRKESGKKNVELTAINTRLQQEVAERETAEKACMNVNEELNSFIRTVSHDLKTPIISIQGFTSRLLKTKSHCLEKKDKEYLERIIASANRMEALVLDLLQLSQVGEVDCQISHVSIGAMVQKVITSLEDTIKENAIRVIVDSNLPEIRCDESRMLQVFENLIVNAIKFTKHVASPTIEIGYENKKRFYVFYIRDNGIGIDPEYHREIFDMFRQLKEIEDKQGTGLGLTIVQRIINRRGGQVWVESEKGKGATFYFSVPKTFRREKKASP
jgi:signal transduction histidine kinase